LFFSYSAITGRQFYNEGDGFLFGDNTSLASNRWEKVQEIYRHGLISDEILNISKSKTVYVIVSHRFTIKPESFSKSLKAVFENKDVTVFELLNGS